MSGTGIRQISHRFMSQIGLLLLSLITDSFCFLFSPLSSHTPKKRSHYIGSMFNGDCVSLNNDNGNARLSRYVMLCHTSDTTLPLFDTSVTLANMNFPEKRLQ